VSELLFICFIYVIITSITLYAQRRVGAIAGIAKSLAIQMPFASAEEFAALASNKNKIVIHLLLVEQTQHSALLRRKFDEKNWNPPAHHSYVIRVSARWLQQAGNNQNGDD
jgi:hypothetical protein